MIGTELCEMALRYNWFLPVLTFTALPALACPQGPIPAVNGRRCGGCARKAREQKKKDSAKPKRVYTDENVNHSTSGGASTSTGSNAASSPEGLERPRFRHAGKRCRGEEFRA